jgi:minor curlin subunit
MKTFIIFFIIASLNSFQCTFAQVKSLHQKSNELALFTQIKEVKNIVNSDRINNAIINEQFFNTDVQLQQIGDHNTFNAQLQAKNIAASVVQKGNNNSIYLDKLAKAIDLKILQLGNNNTVYDYLNNTKFEIKSEFVQKGNNNTIKSFGSNSISQDLKVIQSGNGASVLLINN